MSAAKPELENYWKFHDELGLTRVVNVAGTMTALGASICSDEVKRATVEGMSHFVDINELQAVASARIAKFTGAQAGCLTASASAGLTISAAGCITGTDPGSIEALPKNPGPKSEIVMQAGHMCGYGSPAPVAQAVELSGATVKPFGQATLTSDFQLRAAISEKTAAALFVVSHHCVPFGQMPLDRFCEICKEEGVPVIVDAASEERVQEFFAAGADLAIFSIHKYMRGPTAGIVAGRADLVAAAYMQNMGIGRGMKVGKESMVGALAAIRQWESRDHEGVREAEKKTLESWRGVLSGFTGVAPVIEADPTGNSIDRLIVHVDPEGAGAPATTYVRALGERNPAIVVRCNEADMGFFHLDPTNLIPGQDQLVAEALQEVFAQRPVEQPEDKHIHRNGGVDSFTSWLGKQRGS